jgi:hypothetical protein
MLSAGKRLTVDTAFELPLRGLPSQSLGAGRGRGAGLSRQS